MPRPLSRTTRFGPQPIRELLLRQGVIVRDFALSININPSHAIRANRGIFTPAPIYVERASEALGVPAEKLFTAEAREAIYLGYMFKNRTPVDLLKRAAS